MEKRGKGRPTKLTPELHKIIVEAVRAGNYVETAAALADVSKESLYKWLRRGSREIQRVEASHLRRIQNTEVIYVNFVDAVQNAQAAAESEDLGLIGKASKSGAWQASAWRLERKFPNKWGHKARVEVTGKEGEPIKHEDVTKPSEAEQIRDIEKHVEELEAERKQIALERAKLEREIARSSD